MERIRSPPRKQFFPKTSKNIFDERIIVMTYYEQQEMEIATEKPRTFKLKLSDADVVRIFEKAGSVDLTPSELMESFIGDLICGTHTHGSDERMYANEWFDRCGFYEYDRGTFLRYILSWDYYNKVKNCLDDIDENEEEIRQLADDEDFDEDRKYFGLLIEDSRKELLEIFEEYCESNRKHETFKKAIEEAREYRKNLERALRGNKR